MPNIHESIAELIEERMEEDGLFHLSWIEVAYQLKYKSGIDRDQIKTTIRRLNEMGYTIVVDSSGTRGAGYYFLKKKGERSQPVQTKPGMMSSEEAKIVLGIKEVGSKEEVKQAFFKAVKEAATGDGGYTRDMDLLVKAKESLLASF